MLEKNLTAADFGAFVPPLGAPGEVVKDDRRSPRRFPYPHVQQVAFFDGVVLPPPEKFQPVRCHDISQEGLSFFYPAAPAGRRLVISLGSKGLETYLLANVQYHVPAQAAALFEPDTSLGAGFLIGCQFVRRLSADEWRRQS